MISPLPRNKRAKNPHDGGRLEAVRRSKTTRQSLTPAKPRRSPPKAKVPVADEPQSGGLNNPFANFEIK